MGSVRSTENISLGELYRSRRSGKFRFPDWQRASIWSDAKKNGWKRDVNKGQIPGVFITFNIKGEDAIFINDGAQRTKSTEEYVEELKGKGLPEPQITEMLDNVKILKQHIEYRDNEEAWSDFFRINQGTLCTPYELGVGILSTKLNGYETIWRPLLEKLHKINDSAINKMQCCHFGTRSREKEHKHNRDDYALFLRFATKNKLADSDNAGQSKFEGFDEKALPSTIEYKLQEFLNKIGHLEFNLSLKSYEKFINDQVALYDNIWRQEITDSGYAPTATNVRWYLCVAIYRYNNSIPVDKFNDFIKKYIQCTKGGAGFVPQGKRDRVTVALSNLQKLNSICKYLPIRDFGPSRKAKQNRTTVKDGYDHSHVKPLVKFGDGETILEPHLTNLSRGITEIDLTEKIISDL